MNKKTLIITAAAILSGGLVYGMSQHARHADPAHSHEEVDTGHLHAGEISEHGNGMMACPMMRGEAAVSMDKMREHMSEMTKRMQHMKTHMAAMREACGMKGQHPKEDSGHVDEETATGDGEDHSHDH